MTARTQWIPADRSETVRRDGYLAIPMSCPRLNEEQAMQNARDLLAQGAASVGIYKISRIIEVDRE